MREIIVKNPITRISGFMQIEVTIENNKIIDAKNSGFLFRGFEIMLKGRSPIDAMYYTERICGICSTAHSIAASTAVEDAFKIVPDQNGVIIREIMHGSEILQNHIRHFYQFTIPDYAKIDVEPAIAGDEKRYKLPKEINSRINTNYIESFKYSRSAHKMLATLGGKAPHAHGNYIGGVTVNIDTSKLYELKSLLFSVKEFVNNVMVQDLNLISKYYPEDFKNGRGYGNFLTYGAFDSPFDTPKPYVKSGVLVNNSIGEFDRNKISEDIIYSYYSDTKNVLGIEDSNWNIDNNKKDAYTWVKAARYNGIPMEVGPLARLWVNGDYKNGISTLDRTTARVLEAVKICDILEHLLSIVKLTPAVQQDWQIPDTGVGAAFRDTCRGALSHTLILEGKKISNYNIITPSCWNLSPTDSNGNKGVVEKALIGSEIEDTKNPAEIGRIIRSFDPCVSCATHVISDKYKDFTMRIVE